MKRTLFVGKGSGRPTCLGIRLKGRKAHKQFYKLIDGLIEEGVVPEQVACAGFKPEDMSDQIMVAIPVGLDADDIIDAIVQAAFCKLSWELHEVEMASEVYLAYVVAAWTLQE